MVSSTRTWKNFARERLTVWGKLIIEEFGIDEEDVTREIDYASRALQAIRGSIPKEADKPKVGIRVIAGGPQISTTAVSQTLSQAPSTVDMSAQNDEQQQPGMCIYEKRHKT